MPHKITKEITKNPKIDLVKFKSFYFFIDTEYKCTPNKFIKIVN